MCFLLYRSPRTARHINEPKLYYCKKKKFTENVLFSQDIMFKDIKISINPKTQIQLIHLKIQVKHLKK